MAVAEPGQRLGEHSYILVQVEKDEGLPAGGESRYTHSTIANSTSVAALHQIEAHGGWVQVNARRRPERSPVV
jgi:hypothetical protein